MVIKIKETKEKNVKKRFHIALFTFLKRFGPASI